VADTFNSRVQVFELLSSGGVHPAKAK